MPWYQLFQILKRLEWQGEIRRGYFIEGLSGVQFALPKRWICLKRCKPTNRTIYPLLCSSAPRTRLCPFGGAVDWDLRDLNGEKLTIVRAPSNHLVVLNSKPILYGENYGSRLWQLENTEQETLDEVAGTLKTWLMLPAHLRPRKRIEIMQINDKPASESGLGDIFLQNGFERDGEKVLLWPSGV